MSESEEARITELREAQAKAQKLFEEIEARGHDPFGYHRRRPE